MIDGLALGETTPGPLIMVVAFVGFVGGWLQTGGSGRSALFWRRAGGHGGDLLHLPALVRVHPGGRSAGRGHARQAALHRAALGHHRGGGRRDLEPGAVLRVPRAVAEGFGGHFDAVSAAIAVAAAVALFRFRLGVLPLLGGCAAIGLLATLVPGLR
jgi:chromate transporter